MPSPTPPQLVAELAIAFWRDQPPDAAIKQMIREIQDIPAEVLEPAVRHVIRTATFFPKVSEVRRASAEVALALPGEAEALAQIDARIEWGRLPENERYDVVPLHPLVQEALDRVGGWFKFRSSEEATIIRGQFGRLYRELRAAAVQTAQTGNFGS